MATLLFDEPPLVVSPTLACAIGLQEAIVLQQMHYWLSHSKFVHDDRHWVYNTYEDWAKQFPFWKPETIRKIIAKLRGDGLIDIAKLSDNPWDKTNYYAINYAVLATHGARIDAEKSTASERKSAPVQMRKNPPHHCTENTETTTENTERAPRRRAARASLPLASWLEACKTSGEKAIPEDDSIFSYADKLQMNHDFILYAWLEFKRRYAEDDSKKYKDWRATFRNAVRENWFKLWFIADDGSCGLTTRGKQVQREHSEGA
jgi:hypothetical protein